MDVGIISQAATPQPATDLYSKQSNAVIEQLRAIVSPADIKTVNFSVNPNYQYPKDGGTPVILGYTANNTVRIEIDDLSMIRKAVEVATKARASNVNRLNFMLRDEANARAEALGRASTQARAGAEALAASLKMKLGRVLRLGVHARRAGSCQYSRQLSLTFELVQQAGSRGSARARPRSRSPEGMLRKGTPAYTRTCRRFRRRAVLPLFLPCRRRTR